MKHLSLFYVVLLVFGLSLDAQAQRRSGGGWSFGATLGLANADQKDMDSVIDAGGTADKIGNGYEFGATFAYSFGSTELLLRPSWYTVSSDGGGNEYSLNAFSILPMLRFNLLSNQTITFYSQLGLGYTVITGEIKEGSDEVEFSGSDIGYAGGLGAEFCFIASHCFFVEGNVRVSSVERMTVDKASGTPTDIGGITQGGKGQELEISNRDFGASLSGIYGVIGYNLRF